MHIARPEYLHFFWIVPAFVLFFWWTFRRTKQTLGEFAEPNLADQLITGVSRVKPLAKRVLFVLFLLFTVLALVRPQWGVRLETVRRTGVDIMVALDTSLSMETQDVVPSRLEKAKHEIRSLIDVLEGDRVGLVVFAGMGLVNCPLTIDQNAVKMFLDIVDTQTLPRPGTNIGEAIRLATQAFNDKDRHHKVMVLVTDGENLEGDPLKAAEEAAKSGVVIFSLGVGTGAGEPIPLRDEQGNVTGYKKEPDGSVVVSRLDEGALKKIAGATSGKYFRATPDEDEVKQIYEFVSQMDQKEFQSRVYQTYVDRFQLPLGIAILLVIGESLISERKKPGRWQSALEWLRR